ncbi:MAG: DUF2804 domain-containing protein [Solobacterium sp.]|nr:DUF2804 domain-containing protein [Solobacterium sp.]
MQKRITERGKLLNEKGELMEAGYATELIREYSRKDIKANPLRIKEWDYYLISNNEHALALTISDNSYMGLMSVSWIDFTAPSEKTMSEIILMPKGKTNLPSTSISGDVSFHNRNLHMTFANDGQKRHLTVNYKNFRDGKSLNADLVLFDVPRDSMVIATPYKEDKKAFYYNQKINCLRAQGYVSIGNEGWQFAPDSAFAVLDWGRGVWTYSNTWYWSSLSAAVGGKRFGFNLGYGFGDTSAASENMVFVDGKAHKLSQVTFNIPLDENGKEEFMKPWTFTSDDQRVNLDFVPVIDRAALIDLKLVCSDQHQVFGRFSGTFILDDGTPFTIKDLLGFAEKVSNKW